MPIIEEIIQNDSTVNNNNKLTSEEEQVLFDSLASKIANDPEAFKRLTSKVTSKDFNRIQVQPQAGFVCKTKVVKTRNKKYAVDTIVYINICYASAIPAPTIASEREIQKALNAEENTNYKVPVSMGEARMEQENTSLIMDACIHPEAYVRSEKDLDYRLYILELSMEYVEEILEVNLSREFTMPNTRSKGMIPSRLLKIPKPSLMQSILNELKKTIDNHQWKLEPEIKLEGKEERLKLIIPMPDNNKNSTSWTIDITTNKVILCINEKSSMEIPLKNQIDIKSDINSASYYSKSNHLVILLKLLDRTRYL